MDVKIPTLRERLEAFGLPEVDTAAQRAVVRLGAEIDRRAMIYRVVSRYIPNAKRRQSVPELVSTRATVFDENWLSETFGSGRYRIELRMNAPGKPTEMFEIYIA